MPDLLAGEWQRFWNPPRPGLGEVMDAAGFKPWLNTDIRPHIQLAKAISACAAMRAEVP